MLEFFGKIMGLTATLISAIIFLLMLAVLARYGLLDDVGQALLTLVLLPVKLIDFLIRIGSAAADSGLFGGDGGTPTPTTGP